MYTYTEEHAKSPPGVTDVIPPTETVVDQSVKWNDTVSEKGNSVKSTHADVHLHNSNIRKVCRYMCTVTRTKTNSAGILRQGVDNLGKHLQVHEMYVHILLFSTRRFVVKHVGDYSQSSG